LKTFRNGEIQFQYASLLVNCEKKAEGDGYIWVQDSCKAYFPVCDIPATEKEDTIACIAYPRAKFADAPTFEAAAFGVFVTPAASEKECTGELLGWEDVSKPTGKSLTIHGVQFKEIEFAEAGMSQGSGGEAYLTFHNGKCYGLTVTSAWANPGAFDEGINEFSKEDGAEVERRLNAVLESFQFVR